MQLPDRSSTRTFIAPCITCRRLPPRNTKRRGTRCRASSTPAKTREVIFTSGTTDAINLVAHGYGRKFFEAGDEIILTTLEHHSNIVPWQMVAEEKGAKIRVVPINDRGELLVEDYRRLFNAKHEIRRNDSCVERAGHDHIRSRR